MQMNAAIIFISCKPLWQFGTLKIPNNINRLYICIQRYLECAAALINCTNENVLFNKDFTSLCPPHYYLIFYHTIKNLLNAS